MPTLGNEGRRRTRPIGNNLLREKMLQLASIVAQTQSARGLGLRLARQGVQRALRAVLFKNLRKNFASPAAALVIRPGVK